MQLRRRPQSRRQPPGPPLRRFLVLRKVLQPWHRRQRQMPYQALRRRRFRSPLLLCTLVPCLSLLSHFPRCAIRSAAGPCRSVLLQLQLPYYRRSMLARNPRRPWNFPQWWPSAKHSPMSLLPVLLDWHWGQVRRSQVLDGPLLLVRSYRSILQLKQSLPHIRNWRLHCTILVYIPAGNIHSHPGRFPIYPTS